MRKPSSSSSSASGAAAAGTSTGKKTPCCSKIGLKRGPWTPEEDELLSGYINREGEGRWRTLPKRAGLLRCGKSCRLRWMNYLRPSVKRGQIAPDEEDLILRLHRLLGNRWSLIAGRIPGRTDNEIKNYWNTHLSKKLISQGIDPRTHKPLDSSGEIEIKTAKNHHHHHRKSSSSPSTTDYNNNNNNNPNSSYGDEEINNPLPNNLEYVGHYDNAADDDINYCNDDVFSSFLNSLINEDGYQQHHPPPPNPLVVAPPASAADSLLSITAGFGVVGGFGAMAGWESALVSCPLMNQNEPNKLGSDSEHM